MLLHPLLLRPQDQEIHDHEDQNEGQHRDQQAVAAQTQRAALRKCRRDKHRSSPLEVPWRRPAAEPLRTRIYGPKSARTIAAAASIATRLWARCGDPRP